jgi:hypothetical protein
MVIAVNANRVVACMSSLNPFAIVMKKLIRLVVGLLAGAVFAGAWAQPGAARQMAIEAQREARAQQQMQREQRRVERVESMRGFRAQPPSMQPNNPLPAPPPMVLPQPRPPMVAPQPAPPVTPAGGPRRLTPEERQQLRDQIRDARRMYQQGQ